MGGVVPLAAQTDLDAFMKRVVSRRDDNWQKLQQYILDESEVSEVRGPGGALVWAQRSKYTWFLRDGMFVRSPLEANGVAIGEADRRKSEDDYVRRERRRAERAAADAAARSGGGQATAAADSPAPPAADPAGQASTSPADPSTGDGLLMLVGPGRTPGFITSAYFLEFKFDEGRYAFVGREMLEDREVLRIEYYPTSLFRESDERRERQRERRGSSSKADARSDQVGREIERLMNKTSLVTLWVDPKSEQILKYVFDNVNMEFLPGQWLMQVDDIEASMSMGQPFPDVWLPRHLSMDLVVTSAAGRFDFRYTLDYHDYRQADVKSKVGFPDAR
jgi:hypothetical protein